VTKCITIIAIIYLHFVELLRSDSDVEQTSLKGLLVEPRLELNCHLMCFKIHDNTFYELYLNLLKSDLDVQQTSPKGLLVELRLELSCNFLV
jgi:hypothetical protein